MTIGREEDDESPLTAASEIVLAPSPAAAAEARRFVRHLLRASGAEDTTDVAVLLTSEVVSNAVVHAGTEVTVRATVAVDGVVRVEVGDADPSLPPPPAAASDEVVAETGRGLLIVDTLATRWAAEPRRPAGKTVWFEVSPSWARARGVRGGGC